MVVVMLTPSVTTVVDVSMLGRWVRRRKGGREGGREGL